MNRLGPSAVDREQLEIRWRLKLDEANERYRIATARYRGLLGQKPEGYLPGHDGTLALARQAESEALAEYMRVLKLFTELTLYRRIPNESSTERADGVLP